MSQAKIQKNVEPFLHMIPIGLAMGVSVPFFFLDMYNQTKGMAWCSLVPLPNLCSPDKGDCVRGGVVKKVAIVTVLGTMISIYNHSDCCTVPCGETCT